MPHDGNENEIQGQIRVNPNPKFPIGSIVYLAGDREVAMTVVANVIDSFHGPLVEVAWFKADKTIQFCKVTEGAFFHD